VLSPELINFTSLIATGDFYNRVLAFRVDMQILSKPFTIVFSEGALCFGAWGRKIRFGGSVPYSHLFEYCQVQEKHWAIAGTFGHQGVEATFLQGGAWTNTDPKYCIVVSS
jgi:hypothetical protein